jgi:hypothetical protein
MSEDTIPDSTNGEKTGRGRPRPDATIERDKIVYEQIRNGGPQTRKQIVEATGLKGNEVYLSLYRLNRQEPPAIVKSGASWSIPGETAEVVAETPVEVNAE